MSELHWSEVVRPSASAEATRSAEPASWGQRTEAAAATRSKQRDRVELPGPEVEPVSTFLVALAEGALAR